MKPILCVAGIHDGCISIYYNQNFYNFELEKVSGIKHHALDVVSNKVTTKTVEAILKLAERQFGIPNDFSAVLVKARKENTDRCFFDMRVINYDKLIDTDHIHHHHGHVSSAYFQSPYDKAIVLSYDGGGDDCSSVLAHIDSGRLNSFRKLPYYLSGVYHFIGRSLSIFEKTPGLDVAGKMMGLSAMNKKPLVREHLELLKEVMYMPNRPLSALYTSIDDRLKDVHPLLTRDNFLSEKILIEDEPEYYCDLVQKALEEKALEIVEKEIIPTIEEYDNNLVLVGGTALNILTNEKIKRKFPQLNIYVPPNPTDVGIPFGILAQWLFDNNLIDKTCYDLTSTNFNLIDANDRAYEIVNIDRVVKDLKQGKIIGVINGPVEIGPRALGNRSILCDPSFPEMKDILNAKVKHREDYRPFAPICRREDVEKYFDTPNYDNLDFMSFAVDVRDEYKDKLPAITHYDGTARVQTITKRQNSFIYRLLTKFDGVLLNTSFNVQGKPILNTFKDAFKILDNTELDNVLVVQNNKLYYFKEN